MKPKKMHPYDVLEEGKIPEEPQQTPHNIEARTLAKEDRKNPTINLSQREKTLERIDKGKRPIVEIASLVKCMSPMGTTLT